MSGRRTLLACALKQKRNSILYFVKHQLLNKHASAQKPDLLVCGLCRTVCLFLFFSHVPLCLQVLEVVTQPMDVTMGSIATLYYSLALAKIVQLAGFQSLASLVISMTVVSHVPLDK